MKHELFIGKNVGAHMHVHTLFALQTYSATYANPTDKASCEKSNVGAGTSPAPTLLFSRRRRLVYEVFRGSLEMNGCKLLILLVRPAGFEPATLCLEGRCSIQLSYGRMKKRSLVYIILFRNQERRICRNVELLFMEEYSYGKRI